MNWHIFPEQKKNNKGSTIVTVLVIVALVVLMVTVLLSVSLMNYRMKGTNAKQQDNFYTAEQAMDEMRAGLVQQLSKTASAAYVATMTSYSSSTPSERTTRFQTSYENAVRLALGEASDSSRYSTTVLESYLKTQVYDAATGIGVTVSSATTNGNVLNVDTDHMTLKNVVVTYYGEDSYMSQIQTDVVLGIPTMDFSQSSEIPELLSYSMVANDSFVAGETSGVIAQIAGDVYLGKNGATINNSTVIFGDGGDETMLLTNQALQIKNGSTVTLNKVESWVKEILVDSSKLNVDGTTYVQDDLMLSNTSGTKGARPEVKAVFSGSYYGYSNILTAGTASSVDETTVAAQPADYSSAVIVNGVNTTLDFGGLQEMILAGNSYIGASGKNGASVTGNTDVAMGESISVKSSQTAYLVPAECIAPGTENGGINPMTAARYQALTEELHTSGGALVDLNCKSTTLGVTLSSLGVSGYEIECYPMANIGSMVYVFLKFDNQEAANSFFQKYYSKNQNLTRLQEQLSLYTNQITLPDMAAEDGTQTQFYYSGNVLVNDASTDTFYPGRMGDANLTVAEKTVIEEAESANQDIFAALGTKLVRTYSGLSSQEKSRDVYGNLVKSFVSTDTGYTIGNGVTRKFIAKSAENEGAIIVNGDYTIDSVEMKTKDEDGVARTGTIHVVIASGDVTVKHDFDGLILAGGSIKIGKSGITIEADATKAAVAAQAKDENGYCVLDYLLDGSSYTIGGGDAVQESGTIDFDTLVSYENWTKQ